MATIEDAALIIAIDAHGATTNKHDGELYIRHPLRVRENIIAREREMGTPHNPRTSAVALLHDVLEDTYLNREMLSGALIAESWNRTGESGSRESEIVLVVNAIVAMTKQDRESNEDYYRRVARNPTARRVKLDGDIVDNFRRNHRIADPEVRARMAMKYALGIDILSR